MIRHCGRKQWHPWLLQASVNGGAATQGAGKGTSNGNSVCYSDKYLHLLLVRSALPPPAIAIDSSLCGSPSIDTGLQQPQISLIGHSDSYKPRCLGAAAAYTEPEEEADMLQPTLGSTAGAQAGGLRQEGPRLRQQAGGRRVEAGSRRHEAGRTPPVAQSI